MTDFIVVGRGLAASVIAHALHKKQLTFKIIGLPHLSRSSLVAAGIWNPIVFKRLTKSWLADQTIPFLNEFYKSCEDLSGEKFITQRNLVKPFAEEQEKQLWQKKAKNELADFLDETIYTNTGTAFNGCLIPRQYGLVKQAGSIDLPVFLKASDAVFKDVLVSEEFNFDALKIEEDKILYKNIASKNIIFCEGHLVKNNPYFNWVPLKPVKGEVLSLQSAELVLNNSVLNKNGFIMDLGKNTYKAGATYEWSDLEETPTVKGLEELELKLKQLISSPYDVLIHEAGIRPSSIDRRPITGPHPNFKNLFIFNGLGTKGVMLAPYFANNFVNFYLQKQALNAETDVKRFYHLYNHDK
jgi:glycine oxidase